MMIHLRYSGKLLTPTRLQTLAHHHRTRNAVSSPQSRSTLRSSSPTGLRSDRKFILHAVPSFPPPIPNRNSKEGIDEIGNDDEATNKNNWTTQKESNKA
ncbi:hypothetical protein DVH24_031348 [Malus domestica]|uniref:Uncharacterized protein n=1 Tax=Malus domestica TaxID=3750 RepID=A0A498HHN5_MALDO|nr:hypothetical protein DVH24_031348 [Malus domestica]